MRPDHPLALNSVITPALFHSEPFIAVVFQAETGSRHFADANVQPAKTLETMDEEYSLLENSKYG